MEEIERRACLYFLEQADPHTGLVRDRARRDGVDHRRIASIAATGFGLSALCIADTRGYLDRATALGRVERTLAFLARSVRNQHGFLPHFLDLRSGERAWGSEYSSIDTTWLLCGALHARTHFDTPAIRSAATFLLERVDWPWMLNGGTTLSHGWTPEGGFLPYRWDTYSELLAMYLLAVGSPSYPIPAAAWHSWTRPTRTYAGLTYIDSPAPLFVHQYSHAWFDFRGRRDRHTNYFENSRLATEAHRHFCLSLSEHYPWFGSDLWGITASDSQQGYMVWGGPAQLQSHDGTLVPCAAGGSLPFLPGECLAVLQTLLTRYGNRVWGRYGFVDAFHPGSGWAGPDILGIDQGITLLMAENLRSEGVWKLVMSTEEARRGMERVGLRV